MRYPIETGRVVISTAGHDKGQAFVILSLLPGPYVLMADGRSRKVDHPKKKKIRHLRTTPSLMEEVQERVQSRDKIYDHEIRKHLEQAAAGMPHKEG